ncbi:Ig-like domain-containing protein [Frigoribacterium sp. UYMn621]|uniref:phage tail tube protein n=1 Tax=Frigoribacterium sp. UYMn621 TaxID=3156343 RepID=UPI0033962C9E
MSKNPANGNVKVGWILDSALPLKNFTPAATLIASALDLSSAIAWKSFKLGADASPDIQDRALTDLGNAVTRGAAKYGATLGFFRDQNNTDTTSIYQQAFQAFRVMRTIGWLVVRVNKAASLPWAAGDEVSYYKLIADTLSDDTNGDDSVKFTVTFLPQGQLFAHAIVGGAGVITGVPTTLAKTIAGGAFQLQPILSGASIVSRATYVSSNTTMATVSKGGTVRPLTAGSPTITVSHGSATAPIVCTLTLT